MTLPRSKMLRFLPAAAALPALMGCSANVASSADLGVADAEASPVTAVIVVERSTRFDDRAPLDAPAARGEAVARFVRMRSGGVDEDALRMVGAALEIPAAGSCARVSDLGAPATSGSVARAVELVDVGAVSVETEGAKTSLTARRLPDVVDLVSGVVYTSLERRGEEPFPARGRFVFRAGGGSSAEGGRTEGGRVEGRAEGSAAELEIAPFTVEAVIAGEPADIRLNQDPLGQGAGQGVGQVLGQGAVSIAAGTPVELTWTAGGDASDLVYVDVGSSVLRAGVTRCAFADAGHGVIQASSIAADEGTLSIHRVHRERFAAGDGRTRGIDSGEIRFDFARVVSFHRR
jgi:hypothetical protein